MLTLTRDRVRQKMAEKRLSKKQLCSIVSKLRQCDHSIMYAYVKGSVNLEEHMSAFEERKTLWNRLSQVDYYYSTTFSWEIGFSLWASKYRSECRHHALHFLIFTE